MKLILFLCFVLRADHDAIDQQEPLGEQQLALGALVLGGFVYQLFWPLEKVMLARLSHQQRLLHQLLVRPCRIQLLQGGAWRLVLR